MRIVYLTHYFATDSAASIATLKIAELLSEKGHSIDIIYPLIVPMVARTRGTTANSAVGRTNLRVHPVASIFPYRLSLWLAYVLIFSNIRRLLETKRFDIIISQYHTFHLAPLCAYLISKLYRIPLVLRAHNVIFDPSLFRGLGKFFAALANLLNSMALRKADLVMVLSPEAKKYIKESNLVEDRRILISPNGIDESDFEAKNHEKLLETFDLIFIGSLNYEDGVENIVKAMPLVREKIDNPKLLIIGDGPEKKSLIRLTKKLGLFDNIFFMPSIEHEKIGSYILMAKIGLGPISPTKVFETTGSFPMKIVEYMAMRKPVITGRHSVSKSLVIDGFNGFVVEEEVPFSLASSIVTLLEKELLRKKMGRNARLFVLKNFDWNFIVGKLEERLRKLFDKNI